MNEIQLIQALQQGDKNAFSFLVQTYQHMVFNTVLSIVQQQEEAEDVAQEVFVQAFLSITKFRGDSKISTWLYRIAVTKALDHQRRLVDYRVLLYGNLDVSQPTSTYSLQYN